MSGLRLMQMPQGTTLRYHNSKLAMEDITRIRENEAEQIGDRLMISAYSQLEDQTLKAKEYMKTVQCDIVAFNGEIGQIIRPKGFSGAFTSSSDTQGCALDADTAYRIWGSTNVVGEKIQWEEREYTVRTVFASPRNTALIPLGPSSDLKLSVLALDTQGLADPLKSADEFILRHGLDPPDAITTGAWQPGTARLFMLLPAIAYLALLAAGLIRELWKIRGTPVLCAFWCIGIIGAAAVLFRLSGIRLAVPQSLVPTRWSDFSFWARLMSDAWSNFKDGVLTPKLIPDVVTLVPFGLSAACGTAAAVLLLYWLHLLKRPKTNELRTIVSE